MVGLALHVYGHGDADLSEFESDTEDERDKDGENISDWGPPEWSDADLQVIWSRCSPEFFEGIARLWRSVDLNDSSRVKEIKGNASKSVQHCVAYYLHPRDTKATAVCRGKTRPMILAANSCSKETLNPLVKIPADRVVNGAIDYFLFTGKIKLESYKQTLSFYLPTGKFGELVYSFYTEIVSCYSSTFGNLKLAKEISQVVDLLQLDIHEKVREELIDHQIGSVVGQYLDMDHKLKTYAHINNPGKKSVGVWINGFARDDYF